MSFIAVVFVIFTVVFTNMTANTTATTAMDTLVLIHASKIAQAKLCFIWLKVYIAGDILIHYLIALTKEVKFKFNKNIYSQWTKNLK